jgi:hypothetical protein
MQRRQCIVLQLTPWGSPSSPPPASHYRRVCTCYTESEKAKREERGGAIIAVSAGRKGSKEPKDPNKTTTKKLCFLTQGREQGRRPEKVPKYLALCFRQLTGPGRWGNLGVWVAFCVHVVSSGPLH